MRERSKNPREDNPITTLPSFIIRRERYGLSNRLVDNPEFIFAEKGIPHVTVPAGKVLGTDKFFRDQKKARLILWVEIKGIPGLNERGDRRQGNGKMSGASVTGASVTTSPCSGVVLA